MTVGEKVGDKVGDKVVLRTVPRAWGLVAALFLAWFAGACLGVPVPMLAAAGQLDTVPSGRRGLLNKGTASSSAAQQTNALSATAEGDETTTPIRTRLAEARASLASVPTGTNALPPGVNSQDLALRRALLQRLVRIYEQQLSFSDELAAVRNRRAEATREAEAWNGFTEPRPYSVLLVDALREELDSERRNVEGSSSALSLLDRMIEQERGTLAKAEENIRRLNEQIESADRPRREEVEVAALSWEREEQRLRSQVAGATVGVLDLERQIRQERLAESRVRASLLQRKVVIATAGAAFTQSDLDKVLARLETEQQHLQTELAEALGRREAAEQSLRAAKEETARITGGRTNATAGGPAMELVEVRRAQLTAAETEISVLRVMLETASGERVLWESRFGAAGTRDLKTISEAARRLEGVTDRVRLWKSLYRREMEISANERAVQESRVDNLGASSDLLALAEERLAALRERDQSLLRAFRRIEQTERLLVRWSETLQAARGKLGLVDRVRSLFTDSGSVIRSLWEFELFTAEDTMIVDGQQVTSKRSVTLGKVVKALLILVVGYWITGVVSRFLEPMVVRRFKVEPDVANLFRRWLRFVLIAFLVVFSLVSVKIPLTVFAYAGGALAIGIGFGTQTLIKNFISGIMILFERPFRIGDVLEVGDKRGTLTEIGLRASVLRLWDGTETLMPNSSLLESSLTNWTYSNRKVRFTVTVGVAYGSDTRRVLQLLSEAAERHGLVEKDPKPQTLFTNFGESVLEFELRFWADVTRTNSAQIASDLRQMIAGAFQENGIVMAFPQRDLHVDSLGPLEIRVVPAAVGNPTTLAADAPSPSTAQETKSPDKVLDKGHLP